MILHISRMRRNVNRNVYNAGKMQALQRHNWARCCRQRPNVFRVIVSETLHCYIRIQTPQVQSIVITRDINILSSEEY